MLSSRQSHLAIINGVWRGGAHRVHVQCRVRSPLAQCDKLHHLFERFECCIILLHDRDILPGLFVALWKALEVQAICVFLMSSAIGVIAWVGFRRICLGTDDGTVFCERKKKVWAGRPGGVEEHVLVETSQSGLGMTLSALCCFK